MGAFLCVLILVNISVLDQVSSLRDYFLARSTCVLAVNNRTFSFLWQAQRGDMVGIFSPPN